MPRVLFETERLVVRELGDDDVDAMHRVYGDARVTRYAGGPLDRATCVRWVEGTKTNVEARGYGMCALVEREGGAVVGFAGLVHPRGQAQAELKYALLPSAWGRGLATEVAAALLAHGAAEHGLTTVVATVDPGNAASKRVLRKVGMVEEAPRREEDGSLTGVFRWTAPTR